VWPEKNPCVFERHSPTQAHGAKIHSEMERPGAGTCEGTKSEEREIRLAPAENGQQKKSATAESRRMSEIWAKVHGDSTGGQSFSRSDLDGGQKFVSGKITN
jgi:hypothetical protein